MVHRLVGRAARLVKSIVSRGGTITSAAKRKVVQAARRVTTQTTLAVAGAREILERPETKRRVVTALPIGGAVFAGGALAARFGARTIGRLTSIRGGIGAATSRITSFFKKRKFKGGRIAARTQAIKRVQQKTRLQKLIGAGRVLGTAAFIGLTAFEISQLFGGRSKAEAAGALSPSPSAAAAASIPKGETLGGKPMVIGGIIRRGATIARRAFGAAGIGGAVLGAGALGAAVLGGRALASRFGADGQPLRRRSRTGLLNKNAKKVLRRIKSLKKQVRKAASDLGMTVHARGIHRRGSAGVITQAEALRALKS